MTCCDCTEMSKAERPKTKLSSLNKVMLFTKIKEQAELLYRIDLKPGKAFDE